MKIYRSLKLNSPVQLFGQNKLPIYKEMGLFGHNGVDWSCVTGTPLYWDVDTEGTVYKLETDSAGGVGLDIISEENGQFYKHRFWHLERYNVRVGDRVGTGDLIAYSDNTGLSTGPHLHRALKPVYKDKNGSYWNKYSNNGYYGGIDIEPFFTNIFVVDYMNNLKGQISVMRKIILLYEQLLSKFKK